MGSVTRIVVAIPGNLTRLIHEVVAVLIALVAIIVLIGKVVVALIRIVPDVGLQIGMFDIDTLVEYSYNNRAIARTLVPRLNNLNIGTFYRLTIEFSHRSVVLDVPLLAIQRIVERALQSTSRGCHLLVCLLRQRHSLASGSTLDRAIYIGLLHLAQLRKATSNLLGGVVAIVTHHIPAVQAVTHSTLLVARVDREDSRNLETSDQVEYLIHAAHTATGEIRTDNARLFEHRSHLLREFHQNLARSV